MASLCRVLVSLLLRKGAMHVLICVCFYLTATVFQHVLCLPVSMTHLARLLPPGSSGEVRSPPTQQRMGTVGGGHQVAPSFLSSEATSHSPALSCVAMVTVAPRVRWA